MSDGTRYNQKDIVLLPFPYSDLTGAKQRPALIISNKNLHGPDRICCLITSQATTEGLKITKKDFAEGTLPFESWAKPHRVFTTHEKIIKKRLCTVNEQFYRKIIDNLNHYLTQS